MFNTNSITHQSRASLVAVSEEEAANANQSRMKSTIGKIMLWNLTILALFYFRLFREGLNAESFGYMTGVIVLYIFLAALGSLFAAVILKYAVRISIRCSIAYKTAYAIAFVALISSLASEIGLLYLLSLTKANFLSPESFNTLGIFISFMYVSFIYGLLIKNQDSIKVGFKNGILVALWQLLLTFLIVAILCFGAGVGMGIYSMIG